MCVSGSTILCVPCVRRPFTKWPRETCDFHYNAADVHLPCYRRQVEGERRRHDGTMRPSPLGVAREARPKRTATPHRRVEGGDGLLCAPGARRPRAPRPAEVDAVRPEGDEGVEKLCTARARYVLRKAWGETGNGQTWGSTQKDRNEVVVQPRGRYERGARRRHSTPAGPERWPTSSCTGRWDGGTVPGNMAPISSGPLEYRRVACARGAGISAASRRLRTLHPALSVPPS